MSAPPGRHLCPKCGTVAAIWKTAKRVFRCYSCGTEWEPK